MSTDALDQFGYPITATEQLLRLQRPRLAEHHIHYTAHEDVVEPGWPSRSPSRATNSDAIIDRFIRGIAGEMADQTAQTSKCRTFDISVSGYSIQQIGLPPFRVVAAWFDAAWGVILGSTVFGNATCANGARVHALPLVVAQRAVELLNAGLPA